jgi:hypothetical protein
VFVRLDHVTGGGVNANHGFMWATEKVVSAREVELAAPVLILRVRDI